MTRGFQGLGSGWGNEMNEEKLRKSIEKNIGFKDHQYPKKCCGRCGNSEVTNPGANIPGLACKIIRAMNRQSGLGCGNSQVHEESICEFYK